MDSLITSQNDFFPKRDVGRLDGHNRMMQLQSFLDCHRAQQEIQSQTILVPQPTSHPQIDSFTVVQITYGNRMALVFRKKLEYVNALNSESISAMLKALNWCPQVSVTARIFRHSKEQYHLECVHQTKSQKTIGTAKYLCLQIYERLNQFTKEWGIQRDVHVSADKFVGLMASTPKSTGH